MKKQKTILAQRSGQDWTAIHADCVEALRDIPDNSIDLSVYSPPFSSLYIYSESARDMGNVSNDGEFQEMYAHCVAELLRVTKPGRVTAIHVKDLVYYSNASEKGDRGLRDFTAECTKTHVDLGWTYHRKVTVDRDPVKEMQKTKADRLLYKNFRLDGARTGGGLPEYIVVFRKWSDGMEETAPVLHDRTEYPLEIWQEWARPVWLNTRETNVLNAKVARDENAERHLCPMPLDLTERIVRQYSNPGDVVLSPFMGIGSEGYVALRCGRKFVGMELSSAYYSQAVKYLTEVEAAGGSNNLFARMAGECS